MKRFARFAAAVVLVAAGCANAQASTIALPSDGTWFPFDVSDLLSESAGTEWIDIFDGSPLNFTFVVAPNNIGELTVVDTGYAGDTFNVFSTSGDIRLAAVPEPATCTMLLTGLGLLVRRRVRAGTSPKS